MSVQYTETSRTVDPDQVRAVRVDEALRYVNTYDGRYSPGSDNLLRHARRLAAEVDRLRGLTADFGNGG